MGRPPTEKPGRGGGGTHDGTPARPPGPIPKKSLANPSKPVRGRPAILPDSDDESASVADIVLDDDWNSQVLNDSQVSVQSGQESLARSTFLKQSDNIRRGKARLDLEKYSSNERLDFEKIGTIVPAIRFTKLVPPDRWTNVLKAFAVAFTCKKVVEWKKAFIFDDFIVSSKNHVDDVGSSSMKRKKRLNLTREKPPSGEKYKTTPVGSDIVKVVKTLLTNDRKMPEIFKYVEENSKLGKGAQLKSFLNTLVIPEEERDDSYSAKDEDENQATQKPETQNVSNLKNFLIGFLNNSETVAFMAWVVFKFWSSCHTELDEVTMTLAEEVFGNIFMQCVEFAKGDLRLPCGKLTQKLEVDKEIQKALQFQVIDNYFNERTLNLMGTVPSDGSEDVKWIRPSNEDLETKSIPDLAKEEKKFIKFVEFLERRIKDAKDLEEQYNKEIKSFEKYKKHLLGRREQALLNEEMARKMNSSSTQVVPTWEGFNRFPHLAALRARNECGKIASMGVIHSLGRFKPYEGDKHNAIVELERRAAKKKIEIEEKDREVRRVVMARLKPVETLSNGAVEHTMQLAEAEPHEGATDESIVELEKRAAPNLGTTPSNEGSASGGSTFVPALAVSVSEDISAESNSRHGKTSGVPSAEPTGDVRSEKLSTIESSSGTPSSTNTLDVNSGGETCVATTGNNATSVQLQENGGRKGSDASIISEDIPQTQQSQEEVHKRSNNSNKKASKKTSRSSNRSRASISKEVIAQQSDASNSRSKNRNARGKKMEGKEKRKVTPPATTTTICAEDVQESATPEPGNVAKCVGKEPNTQPNFQETDLDHDNSKRNQKGGTEIDEDAKSSKAGASKRKHDDDAEKDKAEGQSKKSKF